MTSHARHAPSWRHLLTGPTVCLLLASVLVACTSGGDNAATGAETEPVAAPSGFETKATLVFVVNDWTASALNVAVAEQLIERYLGYPVVPERLDDTDEIYDSLADGSVDAVLEIWPSSMTDQDQLWFERGQVVDLGPLGSVGKVGWFVPRYVVDADPTLATWEGFTSPAVASRFATADTAPRGRFLGTNPDYVQHDQAIIANLGLPFDVEFSGSEDDTETALATATAAGEPILVYWWTPTAAVARHDLVNVALPEPTEACVAAQRERGPGVDCDYPTETIFKAASVELPSKAPDVLSFLQQFTLTTEDQMSMLVAVEVDGLTIDEAAAAWIATNPGRWEPWLVS